MRGRHALLLVGLAILLSSSKGFAFQVVGPRALGMGGAFVAVANDASTVSWNPAGLVHASKLFHLQPTVGVMSGQHVYFDALDELDSYIEGEPELTDYDDPQVAASRIIDYMKGLSQILDRFRGEDVGLWVEPHAGAFILTEIMGQPLGFSLVTRGIGEAWGSVDIHPGRLLPEEYVDNFAVAGILFYEGILTPTDFAALGGDTLNPWDPSGFLGDLPGNGVGQDENRSVVNVDAVITYEAIVTYARTVHVPSVKSLTIGGNVKYIVGWKHPQLLELEIGKDDSEQKNGGEDDEEFKDEFDFYDHATGYSFGVDLGMLSEINEKFRLGLTVRNLIAPKISWDDEALDDTKLSTDVRAGVAWLPRENLVLAVDLDITKRDGQVEDFRFLSMGGEWSFLRNIVSLRTGLLTNLAAEDVQPTFTFGLGVRAPFVGIEIAAAANSLNDYRDLEQVGAALSVWLGI